MTNRRTFLKSAGLGIAAVSVPGIANASIPKTVSKRPRLKIKLGVASYSLRAFSQEEALDMTLRCGVNRITFKSMHLPLDSDTETIKKAVALCKAKGVTLYGGGVITMKTTEDVDQAFAYAKAAEMIMIIGNPTEEMLPYIEKKVKETDIKLAIHNHGPDKYSIYQSAVDVYEKIKHMDKRMGLCVDIGHTVRLGRDPVEDVKYCFDRVFDIHIKDVTAATAEGKTSIVGRGLIDIVAFLKAIIETNYTGTLALEYEADENDPLPGMMASHGYIQGVLATL
jgi:inosose dehydratase